MNIKKYFRTALAIAISTIAVSSCVNKDEWDTPPINCNNKFDAPNTTLAAFKALAPASGYVLITDDQIFDGYIISSDENGNFYKTISFQDKPENPTAGLQIEVDKSSNYADFPVGTHIRINAKGLRVGTDRGAVKIGSVDPNYAIGRIPGALFSKYISGVCDGTKLQIVPIKPTVLPNLDEARKEQYINTLVQVANVQFADFEMGKTYVQQNPAVDTERSIVDASGFTTVIRNSAFASFGSEVLPAGNGTATFVVSRYNINWQMYIRSLSDIKFTGQRFSECSSLAATGTLGDLKGLFVGTGTDPQKITADMVVEGYVSSSDITGNIYKTLYIQDQLQNPTQGLTIVTDALNMYAKYPVGTKVSIKAKDLWLSRVGGIVQLTNKNTDPRTGEVTYALTDQKLNSNVIKACQQPTTPVVPMLITSLSQLNPNLVGALVKFERAQFTKPSLYNVLGTLNSYANPGTTTNRLFDFYNADRSKAGSDIIIRNSPYSTFAFTDLPTGNGFVQAIYSNFNGTHQLYLRDLNDISMTGQRYAENPPKGGTDISYPVTLSETFESYAIGTTSPYLEIFPKYINAPVEGNRYWQGRTFGGNKYIQLGANSGTGQYETYFIVPVNFTPGKKLTFDVNIGFYNGNALKVYTSTNYIPLGDVNAATLNEITSSFTIPTNPASGYGTFSNAGSYVFPTGLSGNGFIMFKYVGNGSGVTTTLQLDNIVVQ